MCPEGRIILAVKVQKTDPRGKPYSTFKHSPSESVAELLLHASKLPKTLDVYFALASWKQGFHTVVKNGKEKTVIRVRDNVDKLKALWFDIDFKDGYGDAPTAVKAIAEHCKAIKLPAPSIIVSSGNGLHAYWPFTEAVSVQRWQALADEFKEAAKKTGLQADLVCSADACRILRLPGTQNNKNPADPKPVKILHSSGKLFSVEELEQCFFKDSSDVLSVSTLPSHLKASSKVSEEFTGTNSGTRDGVSSSWTNVVSQCGFAKYLTDTRGAESSEPEWKDALQLLSRCEDGELYLHDISDGHPDYDPDATREKFAQRKENTAGPTLCSTFESYRPDICRKCPHWGKVKTPLHLGQTDNKPVVGMPSNYRVAKKGGGIQKLTIDDEGTKEWVNILRYTVDDLSITRSVQDNSQEGAFNWWAEGGEKRRMELPSAYLGNAHKLREFTAENGMVLIRNEPVEFTVLMGTWIEQLQRNRKETKVTEQLGWVVERNEQTDQEAVVGFSCGSKTFMRDGKEEGGVRVKKEYESIAKYYEPKGSYDVWKNVAQFIVDQNYAPYLAVLSTAFAAPLMRLTGEQGAIISLYSSESGVGKSTAMKIAQAVWGSPIHGINSVNDTQNSVIRKVGFLNNLPAYWDELRGDGVMDKFCELAFIVTQGKEKSRLDASSRLKTSVSWSTIMVAASNDSIFDALGMKYKSTDAGMARVFELVVLPVASEKTPAQIANMVDTLQSHYGHAGREYARYVAANYAQVEEIYKQWQTWVDTKFKRKAVERYWFATMTAMLAGATIASRAGIVNIDVKALASYLGRVLAQLRARTNTTVESNSPMELVAQYEQAHQDRILTVKEFPPTRTNGLSYDPEIVGSLPQSGKVIIWRSTKDKSIRFSRTDFTRWLLSRQESPGSVIERLKRDYKAVETKSQLAFGTKLALPRMQVLEVPYE